MDTAPAAPEAPAIDPTTAAAEAAPTSKLAALPALVRARVSAGVDDLQHRAKELQARAKLLQARAKDLPAEARGRALALVARVRIALDLPSRSEIAELTARLDRLDQRIATLSGGAAPVATLAEGAPEVTVAEAELPEHQRKDKRRTNAAKTARR
jgi:hypothetical protein